ncbi:MULTISPECIES: transglutaminase-like domain-containing protein [Ramlibacter]|uniref:Transglutaminase family protein n=1 Tax=Ramlibacter pinisoli TaxID=2682844 RepID=A0A6N8IM64_9BURK|nr:MULTISPECIES: transglutaminase family protein [Ramlibacter]MBA2960586.1 transglutaminase family protein [Ramlibacter sp. CGMCC 1.13660]MVQ27917.1 transglutaminase family protein [Ramlibacter pinisoli]
MHLSTVEARLEYNVRQPSHLLFNVEAAHWSTQVIVAERLEVTPPVSLHAYEDAASGNRFVRFDARPGPLVVAYKADVEVHAPVLDDARLVEVPVNQVPDAVLRHLLPTRFCESDLLAAFARERFGALPPGVERVRAIVRWVRETIAYRPGSSCSTTTAQEVIAQRAGVCRDFAHVAITLCRALNIPARLVAGYVWFDEPPQDFHAIFEAWLGGRWVLFDPTGMAPVERLVRIGTGRDAKDVAFSTSFGDIQMVAKLVTVLEHDARAPLAASARERADA